MKEEINKILRLAATALLFAAGCFLPKFVLPLFLAAYIIAGYDVLFKAVKHLLKGKLLDENFLMTAATVGAFAIGEYPEGVFVMAFYQIGELFQDKAVDKSRAAIEKLMNLRPETARAKRGEDFVEIPSEDLQVGDVILVNPGEKIPVDSLVLAGTSTLSALALTGESAPKRVDIGEPVLSGCVNLSGVLTLKAEKPLEQSTVTKILELAQNARYNKSKSEQFITKFSRVYTPLVVGLAMLLWLVPSLLVGDWLSWAQRALSFLVVSCPCALVVSVPLSFFGGIGAASKQGILVKGSGYLERLADLHTVMLDKTGTLTHGVFQVKEILPARGNDRDLLLLAGAAEQHSPHPIGKSIVEKAGDYSLPPVTKVVEIPGNGVACIYENHPLLVGKKEWLQQKGIAMNRPEPPVGTAVYVAYNGVYQGCLVLGDQIKENAQESLARLKTLGVQKTVMLTGDSPLAAEQVAAQLRIDETHAGLLPSDKVACLEGELGPHKTVAFVGDGINDAPVLMRADVGIAMGAMGSDAAMEAADVVILDDNLARLPMGVEIARRTLRIVKQNIVLAIGIKAAILLLSAVGVVGLWWAVFADVGVTVLATLNALRCLKR